MNENSENNFGRTTSSTSRILISANNNNNNRGQTRATTTTPRSILINNQAGQGNNQNQRPATDSIYFENSDTSGFSSGNQNNNNFPRPLDQRHTTTTRASYTQRPSNINSHTTKKESYFPGDLPFFNGVTTVRKFSSFNIKFINL